VVIAPATITMAAQEHQFISLGADGLGHVCVVTTAKHYVSLSAFQGSVEII
jgi:hypothetical protein